MTTISTKLFTVVCQYCLLGVPNLSPILSYHPYILCYPAGVTSYRILMKMDLSGSNLPVSAVYLAKGGSGHPVSLGFRVRFWSDSRLFNFFICFFVSIHLWMCLDPMSKTLNHTPKFLRVSNLLNVSMLPVLTVATCYNNTEEKTIYHNTHTHTHRHTHTHTHTQRHTHTHTHISHVFYISTILNNLLTFHYQTFTWKGKLMFYHCRNKLITL